MGIRIWRSNTVRLVGFLESIYIIDRIPCIQVGLLRDDPVKESIHNIHISDGSLSVYALSAGGNLDTANMIDS